MCVCVREREREGERERERERERMMENVEQVVMAVKVMECETY